MGAPGAQGWRGEGAGVKPNASAIQRLGMTVSRKRGSATLYEGSSGLSRSGRPRKRSCFWGQDAEDSEDYANGTAVGVNGDEEIAEKAGRGAREGSEGTLTGEVGVNARRKPALDMLSIQVGIYGRFLLSMLYVKVEIC
jgi:hypothetical protein